jgi:ATPase subunit of ABC transporter with duplicated ATPase domains
MALRHRLDKLERRVVASLAQGQGGGQGSTLAEEVREIDRDIKRLRAEIEEAETHMTPEEVARRRAEHQEFFMKTLDGLELDERIEALSAEIAASGAAIEAAIEAEEKGIR